jgi:hypothetical protein
MQNLHTETQDGLEHRRLERRSTMFSLTRNLFLTLAAAVALAIVTASIPASSVYALGYGGTPSGSQQRAQAYKAFDDVKNDYDRFATKVDPPQEVEQTKKITK